MSETEIDPMDRVYGLVTELLDGGSDPIEIKDTVEDAIREWRKRA